jgi:hypothetical protein
VARFTALVLLVLAFLPLREWLDLGGGDPSRTVGRLIAWVRDTGYVLVVGALLAAAWVRRPRTLRLPDPVRWWGEGGRRADLVVALVAAIGYLVLSRYLFDGRPAVIDEVVQLWQAEWLARGRFVVPIVEPLAFVLTRYTTELNGGIIGQYPPGIPLLLVPGVLIGAAWAMVPLWGGVGVYAWARLVRRIEPHPATGFAAVVVLAISSFWAALAASQLSHVPTIALLLAGGAALAAAVRDDTARPRDALLAGLGLGAAALLRPLEAAAFAIPAGAILLWRVRGGGAHVRALLASGVGIGAMLAVLGLLNWLQTGDPFLFGYVAVWGPAHLPGFHETPWGGDHTPLRGLASSLRNIGLLQRALFESPVPAFLAPVLALALWRRPLGSADRWLLLASLAMIVAHWSYGQDGLWLGPRFHLPLVPLLVLWTVRLPGALRMPRAQAVAGWALGVMIVAGALLDVPDTYRRYRGLHPALRDDVRGMFDAAGVTEGVVLVRDRAARVAVAELRARGVSPARARGFASRGNVCGARALARADSIPRGLRETPRPSRVEEMLCGEEADGEARAADASAAILLGTTDTRRVVRDRHGDNLAWIDETTARERTWVLSWEPTAENRARPPRLVKLDADSAWAAWQREREIRAGKW